MVILKESGLADRLGSPQSVSPVAGLGPEATDHQGPRTVLSGPPELQEPSPKKSPPCAADHDLESALLRERPQPQRFRQPAGLVQLDVDHIVKTG